jgi:hypothetical protein
MPEYLNQESRLMTTIDAPKEGSRKAVPSKSQVRSTERRFWLQVDRQTKASFSTLAEAKKAGTSIKSAYPIVKVTIYDAEESQQITLDA